MTSTSVSTPTPEKPRSSGIKVKSVIIPLNDYAKTLQHCVDVFNENNKKGIWVVRLDLKDYRELVFALIDDALTRNALWSDRVVDVDKVLDKCFPEHTTEFFREVIDFMEIQIINDLIAYEISKGPSWNLITVTRVGNDVLLQDMGDFRIWDWTRMKAEEKARKELEECPKNVIDFPRLPFWNQVPKTTNQNYEDIILQNLREQQAENKNEDKGRTRRLK